MYSAAALMNLSEYSSGGRDGWQSDLLHKYKGIIVLNRKTVLVAVLRHKQHEFETSIESSPINEYYTFGNRKQPERRRVCKGFFAYCTGSFWNDNVLYTRIKEFFKKEFFLTFLQFCFLIVFFLTIYPLLLVSNWCNILNVTCGE